MHLQNPIGTPESLWRTIRFDTLTTMRIEMFCILIELQKYVQLQNMASLYTE
jgi:hypothetical protein